MREAYVVPGSCASHFTKNAPRFLAALSSGAAYALAFPPYHQAWLAWLALVPLLLVVRNASPWGAFGWGYLAGFVAFGWTIEWVRHVTLSGWIVLSLYLALYPAVWAAVMAYLEKRRMSHVACRMSWLLAPALWVLMEWVRSWLFTGFGWALLAYSQWRMLPLIQIARLVTAYGVSFLVVLVNSTIAELLMPHAARRTSHVKREASLVLRLPSAVLVLTLGYGAWRLAQPIDGVPLRVAVIQGNIPQEEKWDERHAQRILEQYTVLTQVAVEEAPDLVIWPETSVPGYLEDEPDVLAVVRRAAAASGGYLLVGTPAMVLETTDRQLIEGDIVRRSELRYYNRAVLLASDGALLQHYDKVHLVPFGEYVPFERYLPQIRQWIEPTGDFTPGSEFTVFEIQTQDTGRRTQATSYEPRVASDKPSEEFRISDFGFRIGSQIRNPQSAIRDAPGVSQLAACSSQLTFGVLICYEDIFPGIVRRLRRNGAQFLVNLTNDAWFGRNSGAADQHAQASLLRAVEEGVWVVRATNTGYSCIIDPCGRIVSDVRDRDGRRLFVPGYAIATLRLSNGSR